jgi:ubiquinone/menaquinone biosynthesis C-methylase UbiE
VGIDIEPAQLDMARAHAAEQAVTNVHFRVDDICDLSFPDSAFEAVFGHTILMQFEDPVRALAEVRRVLKPGGIVGFREPIFSSNLAEPPARHRTSSGSYSDGCWPTTAATLISGAAWPHYYSQWGSQV